MLCEAIEESVRDVGEEGEVGQRERDEREMYVILLLFIYLFPVQKERWEGGPGEGGGVVGQIHRQGGALA